MTKKQTKRILRIVFIIASISSLYFVPWILVKAWLLPLPDTVQAQLNEAIGYGFDGMIVYVDEAGKPPAFYAAGWHNRKNEIPADPQALFKIASINKLYDAAATAKLINDKRFSLDKTLADYFPELVGKIEYADKISLRLMLQHRSGIPDYMYNPAYWENPPESREEALELALDMPANFDGYTWNLSEIVYSRIVKILSQAKDV